MEDIRPPDSAFLAAFGNPDPAVVVIPGRGTIAGAHFIITPTRGVFDNVADVGVQDMLATLYLRPIEVGRIPVGTRIYIPGRAEPYTVRKVYAERDELGVSGDGWVGLGVA